MSTAKLCDFCDSPPQGLDRRVLVVRVDAGHGQYEADICDECRANTTIDGFLLVARRIRSGHAQGVEILNYLPLVTTDSGEPSLEELERAVARSEQQQHKPPKRATRSR